MDLADLDFLITLAANLTIEHASLTELRQMLPNPTTIRKRLPQLSDYLASLTRATNVNVADVTAAEYVLLSC